MNLQLVYRYILSLSKNENMFSEKKGQKKKTGCQEPENNATHLS